MSTKTVKSMISALVLGAIVGLASCAKYQIQLVEPVAHAQPIQRKHLSEIIIDPFHYRLREIDQHLAIQIDNPTDEPVMILSEHSYVVDPENETHPFRGGTIAPNSFITFQIPPVPYYYQSGPHFGIGFGVTTSYNIHEFHGGRYGHPPHYYYAGDLQSVWYADAVAWRWKTGPVRMRIVAETAGERFEHDFLFERIRVK